LISIIETVGISKVTCCSLSGLVVAIIACSVNVVLMISTTMVSEIIISSMITIGVIKSSVITIVIPTVWVVSVFITRFIAGGLEGGVWIIVMVVCGAVVAGFLTLAMVEKFVHHRCIALEVGFPCAVDVFDFFHPGVETDNFVDAGAFVDRESVHFVDKTL